MSYEIKGMTELERQLIQKFGGTEAKVLHKKALRAGAKAFDNVLKPKLEEFKDTGATVEERTFDESEIDDKRPRIIVRWQGEHDRYRLIHLNEYGYTRNGKKYKPRGYGAIARALAEGQSVYYNAVKKELEKGLK